jgi:hypothetical protein
MSSRNDITPYPKINSSGIHSGGLPSNFEPIPLKEIGEFEASKVH